ncbi:helix-turn-helix domain-containing protein [Kiloniella sp. b19]|uniref:helix-turn-helix domain-containing protein n=1 Tax=Kiloniella sp. GXU_MW_B19 TaxID=3141326 RepID=UPI0031DA242F
MAEQTEKKLFIGPRLKRIRKELGLTQARMAEELGISGSYLNLLERGQRPATAQFLINLAASYDIDIRQLAADTEHQSLSELREVFANPLFRDTAVPQQELRDLSEHCPTISEAVLRLYDAYYTAKSGENKLAEQVANESGGLPETEPTNWVRDYLRSQRNHFPSLDQAAEELAAELDLRRNPIFHTLSNHLQGSYGIRVDIMPIEVMMEDLRRMDLHRKRLMISEMMPESGRCFQAAYQLGLSAESQHINRLVENASPPSDTAWRLLRIALANYYAGALMMPYGRFLEAAETTGYDLDILAQRFTTSIEQTAHRLTTLQRPTARGVPFFFLRIDVSGNVSKRFAAGKFHFSKFGGTCPLWNVHKTFISPGSTFTQLIELPDGTQYFSIARTVKRSVSSYQQHEPMLALAIGCDIRHAHRLTYARSYNLEKPDPTPIGVNCRLCERAGCAQRSEPPLSKNLIVDERRHGISAFTFPTDQV